MEHITADNTGNTNGENFEFDLSSGISLQEQQDILDSINHITAQNKEELSAESGVTEQENIRLHARKRGAFFPLLVNGAALFLLAVGVFLLFFFQNREEVFLSRGAVLLDSAERALIQEIRKETTRELEKKEEEIGQMLSKLSGVDRQLQELYSSNQELGADQLAIEADLQRLHTEYQGSLETLQGERSRILEDSRVIEARLRSQLEARTKELSQLSEKSEAELSAARTEFNRLSTEQQQSAVIDAHIAGHYASIHSLLADGRFEDAGRSLGQLRELLNTPSFQGNRAFQTRKEGYLNAALSIEELLKERLRAGGVSAGTGGNAESEKALEELREQSAALEKEAAALRAENKSLNDIVTQGSSQGADLSRKLVDAQVSAETLKNENSVLAQNKASLEQELKEKNNSLTALQTQAAAQTQQIAQREKTITALEAQVAEQKAAIEQLNNQLETIKKALQAISQ